MASEKMEIEVRSSASRSLSKSTLEVKSLDPVANFLEIPITSGNKPAKRYGCTLVSENGNLYLFGGSDLQHNVLADCWEFSLGEPSIVPALVRLLTVEQRSVRGRV